jgi:hypothetical protein
MASGAGARFVQQARAGRAQALDRGAEIGNAQRHVM